MKNKLNQIKVPFKIYQISKLKGIRSKKNYESSHFVSPMFGTKVKDVVAVPIENHDSKDQAKAYDAFRSDPKLTPEEAFKKYGTKYYEFSNLITRETRENFFGNKEDYESDEYKNDKTSEQKIISPIIKKHDQAIDSKVDNDNESRIINLDTDKNENLELEVVENNSLSEGVIHIPKEQDSIELDMRSDFFDQISNNDSKSDISLSKRKEEGYNKPHVNMFKNKSFENSSDLQWLKDQVEVINQTLLDFGIEGKVFDSKKGPTVTRHEIALEPGVNVKKVNGIQDNLMMNLSATSVRIEAPIPGKPYVGIEVPNVEKEIVYFGNIIKDKRFTESDQKLLIALGMDIDGEHIFADIKTMPHGLIAGATNSGKSVCINTILASLLLKNNPDELKLILIDPKMVELAPYNNLPHLITPVITDAKVASKALDWVVQEMERRFKVFAKYRSRNLDAFNENVELKKIDHEKMPHIVIVIDELADLMMIASREVEYAIQRITQKARAAGIHLVVATQRPTTDVIKGTIKSNIPVRIAFKVASYVDSTTILDGSGAETLLGRGDMLFKTHETPKRLQGAYITDDEIYDLTAFIKDQKKPTFVFEHDELKKQSENREELDPLFSEVAKYVVEKKNCSINSIQREFNLGFNRAQSIVVSLVKFGIVENSDGTKAKQVNISLYELDEILRDL